MVIKIYLFNYNLFNNHFLVDNDDVADNNLLMKVVELLKIDFGKLFIILFISILNSIVFSYINSRKPDNLHKKL